MPQYDAVMAAELGRAIVQSSVEGVPTDRFIIGVTIPSISDPDSDAGYFSDYEDEEKKVRLTAVKVPLNGFLFWIRNTPRSAFPLLMLKMTISIVHLYIRIFVELLV